VLFQSAIPTHLFPETAGHDLLAAYAPSGSELMATRPILPPSSRKRHHKAERGRFPVVAAQNRYGCSAGQEIDIGTY